MTDDKLKSEIRRELFGKKSSLSDIRKSHRFMLNQNGQI